MSSTNPKKASPIWVIVKALVLGELRFTCQRGFGMRRVYTCGWAGHCPGQIHAVAAFAHCVANFFAAKRIAALMYPPFGVFTLPHARVGSTLVLTRSIMRHNGFLWSPAWFVGLTSLLVLISAAALQPSTALREGKASPDVQALLQVEARAVAAALAEARTLCELAGFHDLLLQCADPEVELEADRKAIAAARAALERRSSYMDICQRKFRKVECMSTLNAALTRNATRRLQ